MLEVDDRGAHVPTAQMQATARYRPSLPQTSTSILAGARKEGLLTAGTCNYHPTATQETQLPDAPRDP